MLRRLAAQMDAFHRTGAPFRKGDLALVYFGHNDVSGTASQREQSKQQLSWHLDTLIPDGATADGRRLFLMLIHDWSRNPDPRGVDRNTVLDWNAHLVGEANTRERVVAVDVFTLFERIFADPGRFGFTNVTTADPAHSDSTALYYDGLHFGEAGNAWIARLVRHYLTRGWDWANTLAAGSQAAARLEQDIDRGLLTALADLEAGRRTGLFAFEVGAPETGDAGVALPWSEQADAGASGFGVGYGLPGGTSFAFATAGSSTAFDTDAGDFGERGSVDNRAVGFLWRSRLGPLESGSRFLWSRQTFERRAWEAALDEVSTSEAEGELLRLSQLLSLPLEVGRFALRPELELAWERQRVDAYDMADPYLGRVRFGASEADTVLLGVGLGVGAPPLPLADLGTLSLRGGVRLERSLSREDWRVRLREGLTRRTETVARAPVDQLGLSLGADLRLADDAALGLDVTAVRDATTEDSAAVFLRYRRPLGAAGRRPGVLPATTTR
jgi:lysophospholipase L1-like esterase